MYQEEIFSEFLPVGLSNSQQRECVVLGDTFDVGGRVKKTGCYICVPCGYRRHFDVGDTFPHCFACFEGENDNIEEFIKGLGLWEYSSK